MEDENWNDEAYFAAKEFWKDVFSLLSPRLETDEERDAFCNAAQDRIEQVERQVS